jgi:hypothetical protein
MPQMTRYDFGAIAEVIDLDSREDVIVITRDLSFSGCFVKTAMPFPAGTDVRVRITHAGQDFAATGLVVSNTREGMGIEFGVIEPKDEALIQEWLSGAALRNADRNDVTGASRGRVVQLKNRLSRRVPEPCVPVPDPKPKSEPRLLVNELLASARNFLAFRDDTWD